MCQKYVTDVGRGPHREGRISCVYPTSGSPHPHPRNGSVGEDCPMCHRGGVEEPTAVLVPQ